MRARSLAAAMAAASLAAPALAHHGRDFILLETDDMPSPGHAYGLVAVDTLIDKDGARSTEISPGVSVALGDKWAVEPHFHVAKSAGTSWRYDATAVGVRYRVGYLPRCDWRGAVSLEVEKPRAEPNQPDHSDEEAPSGASPRHAVRHGDHATEGAAPASDATLRLVLARTYPRALVAVNLLAGRQFVPRGGEKSYSIGVGALTPLSNGDRAGIEAMARFPFQDGVEVMPGYYLTRGDTSLKLGVGLYMARATTGGTFHSSVIRRF